MRAVISVFGSDKIGIVAKVSTVCADVNANVTSVSQAVLEDVFAMTMLVDISQMDCNIATLRTSLEKLGKEMDLDIRIMHSDIFEAMHSI